MLPWPQPILFQPACRGRELNICGAVIMA